VIDRNQPVNTMRLSQSAKTGNQRAPLTTHLFCFTVILVTVAYSMMNAMNFTGAYISVLKLSFVETSDVTAITLAPVEETESPPAAAATATEGAGDSTPETTEKTEPVSETPEKQGEDNVEFKRYEKVVIVTKIHGPHQWMLLEQSLCLLHFAYNHKVLYDIVAFTATPVEQDQIDALAKVLAPAKFTLVMDNIGFQEEIAALTPAKRDQFLERCQVSSPENLTWWSNCREPGVTKGNGGRVAYNWQAEFRAVRIWNHPALANYKYMLWLDSDGFPSRPWTKDPVGYFIENKGVIMFDHFPQGNSQSGLSQRIVDSFNASVCDLNIDDSGKLVRNVITPEEHKYLDEGNKDKAVKCSTYKRIPLIHGFFHITDLDFYRQPKVLNGLKGLLGDCFLCRSPDDQLAVTIGPAIYAPERSWDMRRHGFNLQVYHNFNWDGQHSEKEFRFTRWWREGGKVNLPAADGVCKIVAGDRR